jgi:L-arabinokinase
VVWTFDFFNSDHGYGHAARSCCILKELLKQDVNVMIVSSVSENFILEKLTKEMIEKLKFMKVKVDVGVFQNSSVEIDLKKTLTELENFWNETEMNSRVELISNKLKEFNCNKIVFDITPIAPLIADRLSVESIAITNFTWDWIYSDYVMDEPKFQYFIDLVLNNYRKTTFLIKLPYFSALETFTNIPYFEANWFSEKPNKTKKEILDLLNIEDKKYLFFSFGGHSYVELAKNYKSWTIPKDWNLLFVVNDKDFKFSHNQIIQTSDEMLTSLQIQYIDLFSLADVIIGKTGYSTVSEVIVNDLNYLYTERGKFIEQEVLIKALLENTNSKKVEIEEILNLDFSIFEKCNKMKEKVKKLRNFESSTKDIVQEMLKNH